MDTKEQPADSIPDSYRRRLTAELVAGEAVLAAFRPDLSEVEGRLVFGGGLMVLTDRRLIHGPERLDEAWVGWPIGAVASLVTRERGGAGQLDVRGDAGRLAFVRYSTARARDAVRFARRFQDARRGASAPVSSCPRCGRPTDRGAGEECGSCAEVTAPRPTASLRRLIGFASPHAGLIGAGFALTLASTAAALVPPYLTQPLIDDVLIPHQAGKRSASFVVVGSFLAGMLVASIVAWLLSWARTWIVARASERVAADLRDRTYRHLLGLSLDFFGNKRTGDLISRISSDTDRINYFLSVNLVDFAADLLLIAGTAAVLVVKSPTLAAATMLPLPLALWLTTAVRRRLRRGFDAGTRAWAAMTSVLADTIPGVRVVKAFAQERREAERFARANEHVVRTNDRVNTIWSFFGPMLGLLSQAGLLVIWTVGSWLVLSNAMRVGTLTLFLTYLARLFGRLESMSRMVQATQRAGASAQRLFEILDRRPTVAEPVAPIEPGRPRGHITLRDVSFRYGTREVLHGIDLEIAAGEMIGLVGATGAGKSTLVNLICRFHDVTSGAIEVDGVDVRRFPLEAYRRAIGVVLQEPFLFFGSVAENIAYGCPEATRGAILAAARAARAHEFILGLPDGYDTPVGERGQNLSGGERQRISIARALLIDPAILILDEATSSVDVRTEREIQEALENLTRGRTTIAIAHRLSTLRRADRLVVMEQGRIVEVGRHDELLARPGGAFARLHREQAERDGLAAERAAPEPAGSVP